MQSVCLFVDPFSFSGCLHGPTSQGFVIHCVHDWLLAKKDRACCVKPQSRWAWTLDLRPCSTYAPAEQTAHSSLRFRHTHSARAYQRPFRKATSPESRCSHGVLGRCGFMCRAPFCCLIAVCRGGEPPRMKHAYVLQKLFYTRSWSKTQGHAECFFSF